MATACMVANPLRVRVRVPASTRRGPGRHRGCARTSAKGAGSGEPVVRALETVEDERAAVMTEDGVATGDGEAGVGRTRADAGAEASTSDSGSAPRWALGAFAASAVALGVALAPSMDAGSLGSTWAPSSSNRKDGAARTEVLKTGYPAGATCGDFSAKRTQVARDILTCNQDNWRENCLAHYSNDLEYTDGPGLTRIRGVVQMGTYLKNQFQFSRQYLTVSDETCAAGTYVAEWSLDMDLGTGELRKMPGISVLRFVQPDASSAGDDASSEEANLVAYHRDYLPDGKIWENAPVVGPLVKFQRETYQSCMLSPKGCVDLLGAPK